MTIGQVIIGLVVASFFAFSVGNGIGAVRMYKWLMEEVGDGKKHRVEVRASLDTAGNLIVAYRLMLHMPHGLYIDTNGQVPVSRLEIERIMKQPPMTLEVPPERVIASTWDAWTGSKRVAWLLQNMFWIMHRIGMRGFLQHFGACQHLVERNALVNIANRWTPEPEYEADIEAALKHVRTGGRIALLEPETPKDFARLVFEGASDRQDKR